jgi:PDZ domain (Also known as DHR or GLGF).
MYLANDANGNIFVEEIVPGGAADKCGLIGVGDRLIATSAIVFNGEMDYVGVSVKKGEEQIRFATRGESFDTVMAAISTWPAPRKMKLEFQRCE